MVSTRRKRALVVEDSPKENLRYVSFLTKIGYDASGVAGLAEAKEFLNAQSIDLVLTDIHLTSKENKEGIELLREVASEHPNSMTLAMSSDPRTSLEAECKEAGATKFIRKPMMTSDELEIAINQAEELMTLRRSNRRSNKVGAESQTDLANKLWPHGMIISPEHLKLVLAIAKSGEIPVVVYGETGTGKEELAKLIHRERCKNEGDVPLISVNCANLSGDLVASTLFGHKKGAFSGATHTTNGVVGDADGGILFLDEIHTLNIECQQRLLRVLNDGTYSRVGDSMELHSQFQVIVASTRDLDDAVDDNQFLLDLRVRLTGIDIELLPLRKRLDEMADFIKLFFHRNPEYQISTGEFQKLVARCCSYYWRGNIRQLYKVLGTLCTIASFNDQPVKADQLPVFKTMLKPKTDNEPENSIGEDAFELIEIINKGLANELLLEETLAGVEKVIISETLKRHPRIGDAADALGVSRSTIDAKRKKYEIFS